MVGWNASLASAWMIVASLLLAPIALGDHDVGCEPGVADPSTINQSILPDGSIIYAEERGVPPPFNTSPPLSMSGFLLGTASSAYLERNGIAGLQRDDLTSDEHCGHGPDLELAFFAKVLSGGPQPVTAVQGVASGPHVAAYVDIYAFVDGLVTVPCLTAAAGFTVSPCELAGGSFASRMLTILDDDAPVPLGAPIVTVSLCQAQLYARLGGGGLNGFGVPIVCA